MNNATRPIIQILLAGDEFKNQVLYAVCKDGTLWKRLLRNDCACPWIEVRGIPAPPDLADEMARETAARIRGAERVNDFGTLWLKSLESELV
jgi:hypothetical protein